MSKQKKRSNQSKKEPKVNPYAHMSPARRKLHENADRLSREFARVAAHAMRRHGIKVYLFEDCRPTPQLSFAVRHFDAAAGINVTASHNPKEYNGFKVYWSGGAQLPPAQADLVAEEMATLIKQVKAEGDTIGGVISCIIKGCPIGLGQPVFGKLHAALGNAMLSINAVKGFAYGEGFDNMSLRGSQQNDVFYNNQGHIETLTNHSGGIQGGISNGQDIYFRVAFKPVATLLMEQHTVNIDGMDTTMKAKGRHDPCVLPRAVPIVEAMAAMTILDYYLIDKTTQL